MNNLRPYKDFKTYQLIEMYHEMDKITLISLTISTTVPITIFSLLYRYLKVSFWVSLSLLALVLIADIISTIKYPQKRVLIQEELQRRQKDADLETKR